MLLRMIKRNQPFTITHKQLCTHTLQRTCQLPISGQINSRVTAQDTTFKILVTPTGVIMPAPVTRADWVQKLSAEGINVPSSWTILQIKAHWAEVKAVQSPVGSEELEMRIKALKKASRKKSDLFEFLQKESIPISQNATIAQMFNAAEKTITEEYEPQGSELLGFGKFGNKTMQEVLEDHPSYVQWVRQTAEESDTSHWRLLRFAKWTSQKQHPKIVTANPKKKGYVKGLESVAKGSDTSFAMVNPTDSEATDWSCTEEIKQFNMGKTSWSTKEKASVEEALVNKDKEIETLKQQLAAAQAEQATTELMMSRNKGRREM